MNKSYLLAASMSLLLVGNTNAADLPAPTLLTPNDGANLPLKKLQKFTWQKVTGATKYQLIFSSDKTFANYNKTTNKCSNTKTCFTYTVVSPNYSVLSGNKIVQTEGVTYFWKTQAISKTQRSKDSAIRSFYVGTPISHTDVTLQDNIETFVSGNRIFSYTKIANDGSILPITAQIGTGAKDWACTKDNKTGLIWEIKTDDGSFRDKDWQYSYVSKYISKFRYTPYSGDTSICGGNECDTKAYIDKTNKSELCGLQNWRLPEITELSSLVYCWEDGNYSSNNYHVCPNYDNYSFFLPKKVFIGASSYYILPDERAFFINQKYFPDINFSDWQTYWSSSERTDGSNTEFVFVIDFDTSAKYIEAYEIEKITNQIRLVHSGK